jgi:GGDEF domain-containing protein
VRTHLELKQARDLLESLASLDGLTGIANRRRFDTCLSTSGAMRARASPFSLALVDVDHFKKYNDTHGHARGDDCLPRVAQALASVARAGPPISPRVTAAKSSAALVRRRIRQRCASCFSPCSRTPRGRRAR